MSSKESAPFNKPPITFKTLAVGDPESFSEMVALEERIWGKEKAHTVEELKQMASRGSILCAIYSGNQMIGKAVALMDANLESSTPVKKRLPKESLYASGAGIDPAFRGSGLQKTLLEKRVDLAHQLNKETVIGCVRPENGASLRNITNTGGRVLAYSPDFYLDRENPTRLVWEIDTTLSNDIQEPIDQKDGLMPAAALEALEREDKRIILLIRSGEEDEKIDVEAQKAMAQILSRDYVGTGIQSLYTDGAGIKFNGIIFRHLSSFTPEVEKRLRERKKKIQDIIKHHD